MPRKGNLKVRTGCLTCKARRVKCDESKPNCKRCIKASLRCEGYGLDRTYQLQLYQPQNHLLGNNTENEPRAIEFFCKVVAPSLSGPTDPYFWTDIVMQFGETESAVRHSIITVSSLFENLQHRGNPSARTVMQRNMVALRHYNAAIRELQAPSSPALVLMTCILFVCIEMLQSNGEVAIRHCYHGLMLLNTSNPPEWALHHLLPIFRRLSILPFYFGDSQPLTDYSHLTQPNPAITDSFSSSFQAQESIDAIYNLTIQLFRQTGEYRLGEARMQPVEPATLLEQDTIHQHLTQWRFAFDKFESKPYMSNNMISELSRIWMFQQYDVCTILSNLLFVTDETDYDLYIPNFKRMVKGARKLADQRKRSIRSDFHFEMGFSPFLFLVAIKCRCLETRIEALRLMGILGAAQESLWDTYALQVIAQRVIDLEHGVVAQVEGRKPTPKYDSLPPDEVRVRHFVLGSSETGSQEHDIAGKEITFYMPAKDGGIHLRRERLSTERFSEALAGATGIFNVDLGIKSASPARREDSESVYVMR